MPTVSQYGADPMQLRALARKLSTAADSLETGQRRQSGELAAARAWQGPSADRFRAEWASSHSRALTSAAEKLRAASSDVERNAREQEAASGADGSSVGGVGARPLGGVTLAETSGVGAGTSVGLAALLIGVSAPVVDYLGSVAEAAGRYWPGVGRFAPRGADGRFIASGADRLRTALRATSDRNWVPSPHAKGISQALTKWGTRVAMVGAVVEFGTSAVEQWNQDADDPSVDGTERVLRATTKGGFSAGGALGGSLVGGKIGLAVGSLIFPGAGSVVGTLIGGVIGGAIGSDLGQAVGDYLISDGFQSAAASVATGAGRAVESAAQTVVGASQAVTRGLSEVGKALRFWG